VEGERKLPPLLLLLLLSDLLLLLPVTTGSAEHAHAAHQLL
jgi:hypothetical protein